MCQQHPPLHDAQIKKITCFNVNCPGAKENMARNVAKVQDEMSKKQRDKVIKAQVE